MASTSGSTAPTLTSSLTQADAPIAAALAAEQQQQPYYRSLDDPPLPPVDFLLRVLESRRYDVEPVAALQTAFYHAAPRPDQVAAYDMELVRAVRSSQLERLIALKGAGRAIDACNRFGESIIHMACRRGAPDMVRFLVTSGGLSVNISDDFGRTPLHDACWTATPSFEVIKIILDINRYMVILCDSRSSLPLSYIHEDHWGAWCEFIMQNKDKYWNVSVSRLATFPLSHFEESCSKSPFHL